jgi:hydroxymethylpyrimidine/phosphomethylpyrimidine kinase
VLDVAYLAGVTLAGWLGIHAGLRVALAVAGGCFLSAAVAGRLVLGRGVRPAAEEAGAVAAAALPRGLGGNRVRPSSPEARAVFDRLRVRSMKYIETNQRLKEGCIDEDDDYRSSIAIS